MTCTTHYYKHGTREYAATVRFDPNGPEIPNVRLPPGVFDSETIDDDTGKIVGRANGIHVPSDDVQLERDVIALAKRIAKPPSVAEAECYNCGKTSRVGVVIDEHTSRRFVDLPRGWFADVGLSDSGAIACSRKCAKALVKNPWGEDY